MIWIFLIESSEEKTIGEIWIDESIDVLAERLKPEKRSSPVNKKFKR